MAGGFVVGVGVGPTQYEVTPIPWLILWQPLLCKSITAANINVYSMNVNKGNHC